MSGTRPLEYLTGFLMGLFGGVVLEVFLILFYDLLCLLLGWTALRPIWWMLLPLPLLCGLLMARFIAALHLEDY